MLTVNSEYLCIIGFHLQCRKYLYPVSYEEIFVYNLEPQLGPDAKTDRLLSGQGTLQSAFKKIL
jgi:hypothetical protein